MLDNYRVGRFARAATRVATLSSLANRLEDAIAQFGVAYFTIAVNPFGTARGVDRAWLTTFPPAWTQRYRERSYLRSDPVARCAMAVRHPFQWPEMERHWPLDAAAIEVLEESTLFGLKSGYTIPQSAGPGFVTLAANKSPLNPNDFATLIAMSRIAFGRFRALNGELQQLHARHRSRGPLLLIQGDRLQLSNAQSADNRNVAEAAASAPNEHSSAENALLAA